MHALCPAVFRLYSGLGCVDMLFNWLSSVTIYFSALKVALFVALPTVFRFYFSDQTLKCFLFWIQRY